MLSPGQTALCLAVLTTALLGPVCVRSQVTVWQDVNGNWQAGANWDNGVPDASTETAVFDTGTQATITRGGSVSDLGRLNFASASIARSITGNGINLYGVSGIGIQNSSSNLQTITSSVLLQGNQTWDGGSGGLSITAGFDTNGYALTLQGNGTFSNQIYDTGSITLDTSGTWNFTGSAINNVTGFTINAGTAVFNGSAGYYNTTGTLTIGDGSGTDTLRLGASNQIEDSKGVTLMSSGVFNLDNFNETLKSLNMTGGSVTTGTGTLTLNNSGGTQITTNASSSTASISGNMALDSYSTTFSVADGSASTDLSISANISGANNRFVKTGDGTLVLSGANSFSDTGNSWDQAITIQAGTVQVSADNNLGNANNNISLQGGTLRAAGTFSTGANRIIKVDSGSGTVEVTSGNTLTHTGTITGSNTLSKSGAGTLTLNNSGSDQMAPGQINISGGTLLLGSSNQISNSTNMTLSGGTFATGGFSETLGTLTLTANSIIDMGAGASILRFANSSAESWTGILSIYNWSGTEITGGGTDQLYFGTGTTGLTTVQLSQIRFYSDAGSTFLGDGLWATSFNGEVVVPEAKAWWSALLLAALVLFIERQRLHRLLLRAKIFHGHRAVPPC